MAKEDWDEDYYCVWEDGYNQALADHPNSQTASQALREERYLKEMAHWRIERDKAKIEALNVKIERAIARLSRNAPGDKPKSGSEVEALAILRDET